MSKRQLAQDADRPCYDRGNASPFCAPVSTDTWELGSSHRFEWNYNYPFYVTAERINLYLYYKENYAYMTLKNFTNLPRADGGLDVKIDKSWFPPQLTDDGCTLYGLYLPEGANPTEELTNPLSQYPRPFNFTVHRPHDATTAAAGKNNKMGAAGSSASGLPIWGIILILLASLGALAAAGAALLCCVRRRRQQEQQQAPTRSMCDASGGQLLPPPPSHIIGANDTTSSIYSTTPMTQHTYASPRNSTTAVGAVNEDRNSRLAESTFMWMLQPSSSPSLASADHGSNRITESLLAQQLSEEDGTASVKYAERRPVTVQSIPHLVASDHELTATLVDDSHPQQPLQQQQQQPPRSS